MEIIKTALEGVVIIEPRLFKDDRGYFLSLIRKGTLTGRCARYVSYRTTRANQVME
mgnify:CR=1 FL=1